MTNRNCGGEKKSWRLDGIYQLNGETPPHDKIKTFCHNMSRASEPMIHPRALPPQGSHRPRKITHYGFHKHTAEASTREMNAPLHVNEGNTETAISDVDV